LGLVIADRGGSLVPSFGVAHPETGRAGLNEPVLLGPGQSGETQRGETVRANDPGDHQIIRNTRESAFFKIQGHIIDAMYRLGNHHNL
jgi:hypothetical protein